MPDLRHLLIAVVKKPPHVVARRAIREAGTELERIRAPERERRLTIGRLLDETGTTSLPELGRRVAERPGPGLATMDRIAYQDCCPGDAGRLLEAAEQALAREVNLLGTGPTPLGRPVDWHVDTKSGERWPLGFAPRLDYARLDSPCDVKIPWEISRLQWLIPVGQMFALDEDPRWADGAREILTEWLDANPYSRGPNWAIAMEAGLRGIVLAWLFRVFATAWDDDFQARMLTAIFLHADFVDRHIELGDVNGNHLDADAAALVVLGLFFGDAPRPRRWAERGWRLLQMELPRQVTPDGVDFEMSTAYHRLVTELFALPALHRRLLGLPVPPAYADRMRAMASFAAAYTRPDGSTPFWGDADDARVLPFGPQRIDDHRYLPGLVAAALGEAGTIDGPRAEIAWLVGPDAAATLTGAGAPRSTTAFPDGGVYVLQGERDHVFVDAGPVGLAGRGGHGHNDCLSLDAVLDGSHLLTDCGSYVYTASSEWRNRFRATACHNTPQIDGAEVNRIPASLWLLEDDAIPEVVRWLPGETRDLLVARHSGYERLASPVVPERTVVLDRSLHLLAVHDRFLGGGDHEVSVPWHLAPAARIEGTFDGGWEIGVDDMSFVLCVADPVDWGAAVEEAWVSPSYGVKVPTTRIRLQRRGPLRPLLTVLAPAGVDDPLGRARAIVEAA